MSHKTRDRGIINTPQAAWSGNPQAAHQHRGTFSNPSLRVALEIRFRGGLDGSKEGGAPAPENGTPHRPERKQRELTHRRPNSQSPAQRKRPGRIRATLAPPVPTQLRTRPRPARRVAAAPAAPLPQLLVLLRQPLALRLDELDVVDRAREHRRLARLRRAVQVAAFALRQRGDGAAEALELRVQALAVLALDLIVGEAAGCAGLGGCGRVGGIVGVVVVIVVDVGVGGSGGGAVVSPAPVESRAAAFPLDALRSGQVLVRAVGWRMALQRCIRASWRCGAWF